MPFHKSTKPIVLICIVYRLVSFYPLIWHRLIWYRSKIPRSSRSLRIRHQFNTAFFCRDVVIHHAVQLFLHGSQLVIMRGEQRAYAPARTARKFFHHGPGKGQTIEGAGAASDLIQNDERLRRGVVEDVRRLLHLHEERGASAREVVTRADAREDPVQGAETHPRGRNERTRLRHRGDQARRARDQGGGPRREA